MPQGLRYGRANRHRGEIEALFDGERRILCLTLGALAELETAFEVDDLTALAERFASGRMKATDMIRVIGAGLRGAGNVFRMRMLPAPRWRAALPAMPPSSPNF